MQKSTDFNEKELALLIVLAAFLFGGWIRIMPAWLAGFPINDGGMFSTMIVDLQTNQYAIPYFTTYNAAAIPFAYPPLGFYLGAAISELFKISPNEVVLWLPGILNALCIPAFYFFSKEIVKSPLTSGIATLIFAMVPHLSTWLSAGGGLTRSLGMFFMLLALGYIYRSFTYPSQSAVFFSILFSGLTVLSHTEMPVYTIAIAILFWLMKARTWQGVRTNIIIIIGVLVITAPWYGTIIQHHGLLPFQSILQTGAHSPISFLKVINADLITEEPYLDLLGVMGIVGIIVSASTGQFILPLMLLVIFIVQPRSAHVIANIPLALAAGRFITSHVITDTSILKKLTPIFISLGVFVFANSMYQTINLSARTVSKPEREAMLWVSENLPESANFLVLSGDQIPYCDPINEWFPALAKRESITTVQGSEWILGKAFPKFANQTINVQNCINEDVACLERETEKLQQPYGYIFLAINPGSKNCEMSEQRQRATRGLITSLDNSMNFKEIYKSSQVVIFQKVAP